MVNRTIQFFGQGCAPIGTDPIAITATLGGNVVYTGTIPVTGTIPPVYNPDLDTVLFTCELPVDFAGTLPMSISLDSSAAATARFGKIFSNYMPVFNPVYTQSEIDVISNPSSTFAEKVAIRTAHAVPPLSPAEIVILENGSKEERHTVLVAHNLTTMISSGPDAFHSVSSSEDSRTNVVINGTAQTRGDTPHGAWIWQVGPITSPESFEYDLTVAAGIE
jgi:hypothetical protein